MLRKGVYPDEYMDDWEKSNKTSLPEKEKFYSNLNMENITDTYYMHAKRVCKDFEIKNLGEYYDLYLKKIYIAFGWYFGKLLKNVFQNLSFRFCNIFLPPRLAWQAALKKAEVKLELLTATDILLMVDKGITEEIYQAIHRYAKANNKYIKDYE